MKIDWHGRFAQQARWTRSLREYLLSKISIDPHSRVLEVGCGTGAVLTEFSQSRAVMLHGLDINYLNCMMATRNAQESEICNGDVFHLPYPTNSFDLVFCHYFILWLPSPLQAFSEIMRVLNPGGSFLIFAEPDYGARIDHPAPLARLGELQTTSLVRQGADPSLARQLPAFLGRSGFKHIQYGISGFEVRTGELPDWWESEWQILSYDLQDLIETDELARLKTLDRQSWLDGSRILWVPTFYLSCIKPRE
jgi:SAM-dependent methyltransferase